MASVFQIRSGQLDALDADFRAELVTELCKHLRYHFTETTTTLQDKALRDLVQTTLSRAREFGISDAADCQRFVNLTAAFGWTVDQDEAWIGEYLRDDTVPTPSERLVRVKSRLFRSLQMQQRNHLARQQLR